MMCDVVKCCANATRFMVLDIGYTKRPPKNKENIIACWCAFHAEKVLATMHLHDKVGRRTGKYAVREWVEDKS